MRHHIDACDELFQHSLIFGVVVIITRKHEFYGWASMVHVRLKK